MKTQYYFFWLSVLICSIIFNFFGVPAPWLLGALSIGITFSIFTNLKQPNKRVFTFAQAFIGISLGSMLNINLIYDTIISYFFSIVFGLLATLALGGLLGFSLYKVTGLDFKTSIYSFIPGGASELLSMAQSDNADIRVVASFHSIRVVLFLALIPLLVGSETESIKSIQVLDDIQEIKNVFFILLLVFIFSLLLNKTRPLPAGTLFYATLLMVLYSLFDDTLEVPLIVTGLGQMLIGATIGLRFDLKALKLLWSIKYIAFLFISILIIASILIGVSFHWLSNIDLWSSVLSWIPAGAGEMASTAIFLGLDETSVISIQLIRLYMVFFMLPFIFKLVNMYNSKE